MRTMVNKHKQKKMELQILWKKQQGNQHYKWKEIQKNCNKKKTIETDIQHFQKM